MKLWLRKRLNLLGLLGAWALIFAVFSWLLPASFPTMSNLETLMRQLVIVGFGAIGMTFIIVSGNIDLSVGSTIALVTVVIALVLKKGGNATEAMILGVASAALAGLINGFLVSTLRVGSFIVTLAGLLAYRGIATGMADQEKVNAPITWMSRFTSALGPTEKWMILPLGAWVMLAVAWLAGAVLRRTVFGRHVVALGSNETAARYSGLKVGALKTWVYIFGGLFIGLAGVMQFSRLTVGDPTTAPGKELDIIAAVVIGGGSLSGGEGSVAGSIIGALIMTTIAAGCAQKGWDNWVQQIVTGVIILVAVAYDRWRTARRLAAG